MMEKGIVLKISLGLAPKGLPATPWTAAIHLDTGSGTIPLDPKVPLEAECPQGICSGDKVVVLLSPGHSLKLRPWELGISLLILTGLTLTHHIILGSVLAHLFLFFCFFKIRSRRILFTPKVLQHFP